MLEYSTSIFSCARAALLTVASHAPLFCGFGFMSSPVVVRPSDCKNSAAFVSSAAERGRNKGKEALSVDRGYDSRDGRTMPYRDNRTAIDARRAELERELADLRPRVNGLAYLKWKQKELETALADLDGPPAPRHNYRRFVRVSAVIVIALLASSAIALHKIGPMTTRPGIECGRDICCGLGCPEDGSMRIDHPVAAPPQQVNPPAGAPINQTPHMTDRSGPPLPARERSVAVDYVLSK
jgi:hypothetical protein